MMAGMFGSAFPALASVASPHALDIAELKMTVARQSQEIEGLRTAMSAGSVNKPQ